MGRINVTSTIFAGLSGPNVREAYVTNARAQEEFWRASSPHLPRMANGNNVANLARGNVIQSNLLLANLPG